MPVVAAAAPPVAAPAPSEEASPSTIQALEQRIQQLEQAQVESQLNASSDESNAAALAGPELFRIYGFAAQFGGHRARLMAFKLTERAPIDVATTR